MGLIVSEVYDALVAAGASQEKALAAASAVPPAEQMATREDIAKIEAKMATKEDLARGIAKIEAKMATKEELARGIAKVEANMATKEDLARGIAKVEANMANLDTRIANLEARIAKVEADMAKLEIRIAKIEASMVTKDDFAKIDKQIAVLRLAVIGFGSTIVGLLLRLTFFP